MNRRVAVLEYHKIGAPPPESRNSLWYIPEESFGAQLSGLREGGWEVIDLEAFLQSFEAPESLPERSALLTFDDGYKSMRKFAVPLLRQLNYPAVAFVATDFIGGYNTFDRNSEPQVEICTWEDLRELQRSGVSVQSHGVSHRWFSQLTYPELLEEIGASKKVLEAGLGQRVEAFAYPYGDAGKDGQTTSEALRQTGYRAAFLAVGSPISLPITDAYRLDRVLITPCTNLKEALAP